MSQQVTYVTYAEAVAREIVEPIENGGNATRHDFDIDAIAGAAIETFHTEHGEYRFRPVDLDHDDFWNLVETHARDCS